MNRLVLIGNGFDLAHGLKTSYAHFINWYWDQRVAGFIHVNGYVSTDLLCTFEEISEDRMYWSVRYQYCFQHLLHPLKGEEKATGKDIIDAIIEAKDIFKVTFSPFFERIIKSIETKGWVDIENEYYELLKEFALKEDSEEKTKELNAHLHFLQEKLIEYLNEINAQEVTMNSSIRTLIYAPFVREDISIEGLNALEEHVKNGLKLDQRECDSKLRQYDSMCYTKGRVDDYKKKYGEEKIDWENVPIELLLPNQIMLLSFNYTQTASLYCKDTSIFQVNQIHGRLDEPESVIFGYGDEMDEKYKELLNKNDNSCLTNIKSIKYLEADNYRKMLSFIDAEPFQVLIMGHSCGNSDRTLLNTLFEHPNCVSIKPYYYVDKKGKDNYLDIVQNISRNFTDMKLMRDRVVNKTYCEPLPQAAEDNE